MRIAYALSQRSEDRGQKIEKVNIQYPTRNIQLSSKKKSRDKPGTAAPDCFGLKPS